MAEPPRPPNRAAGLPALPVGRSGSGGTLRLRLALTVLCLFLIVLGWKKRRTILGFCHNVIKGWINRCKQQEVMPNLNFYLGLIPSRPDGVFIKQFHHDWRGKYNKLEYTHTFIQWLFPLREPGMNPAASPLTPEEEEMFCNSAEAKQNLLESYKLMLDFFGIELCDEDTGAVRRAKNWEERFHNLNRHSHNNLRITRIIKCLGLLGYQHFQAPLVQFFLEETLVNGELPSVKDSALNYFVFSVLDQNKRKSLLRSFKLSS